MINRAHHDTDLVFEPEFAKSLKPAVVKAHTTLVDIDDENAYQGVDAA